MPADQDIDLQQWPTRLADTLCRHGLAENIGRLLESGGYATTDFSGYDTPKESLRMALPGLAAAMKRDAPFEVSFVRSSDWAKVPQSVLKQVSIDYEDGQACVFGNIDERLPTAARDFIAELGPKGSGSSSNARDSNAKILQFLMDNRGWAMKPDATCWCHVHQRHCFVFPQYVYEEVVEAAQTGNLRLVAHVPIPFDDATHRERTRSSEKGQ